MSTYRLLLFSLLLLALSIGGATTVSAQSAVAQSNDAAVAEVLAAFKGKSFADLFEAYAVRRPAQPYPILKRIAISDCYAKLSVVTDEAQQASLKKRLNRALSIFEAEEREVILFRSAEPNAFNLPGIALGISTGLLETIDASEEELLGVAAHELAHEFFVHLEQQPNVSAASNAERQRQVELMCDAVAVAALRQLNYDPAAYARIITKIIKYSSATQIINDGHKSHPSLATRLELISHL